MQGLNWNTGFNSWFAAYGSGGNLPGGTISSHPVTDSLVGIVTGATTALADLACDLDPSQNTMLVNGGASAIPGNPANSYSVLSFAWDTSLAGSTPTVLWAKPISSSAHDAALQYVFDMHSAWAGSNNVVQMCQKFKGGIAQDLVWPATDGGGFLTVSTVRNVFIWGRDSSGTTLWKKAFEITTAE